MLLSVVYIQIIASRRWIVRLLHVQRVLLWHNAPREVELSLVGWMRSPRRMWWSPDRMEIVCIVAGRVTFINLRTRKQEILLPKEAQFWQRAPIWSAMGDKLAFAWVDKSFPPSFRLSIDRMPREWMDNQTIYIVNRNRTDLQQLVNEVGSMCSIPCYLQVEMQSFIHVKLTGTSKSSKSTWTRAFKRS